MPKTEVINDEGDQLVRQGSLRRVILGEHNKENVLMKHNEEYSKIYKSIRQEYAILAEYKILQSENIQGVYVIPSRENYLIWFGVIFVRSGIYEDGVFRFTIHLDTEFPDTIKSPRVIFQSEMFHPVLHPETHELNLKEAFPKWDKHEHHIWQVVKYIHWIFNNFESSCSHAINKEALEWYSTNKEEFLNKVKETVSASKEHLYDRPPTDDKHYITFEPYSLEVHSQAHSALLRENNDDFFKFGYSWVLPGSFKPLSRPPSPDFNSQSNS